MEEQNNQEVTGSNETPQTAYENPAVNGGYSAGEVDENAAEIEQQLEVFRKSRNSLGTIVVLTIVNVVLGFFEAEVSFPFSAIFPSLVTIMGKAFATEYGLELFTVIGIALAIVSILLYAGCWFFAKKHRGFLVIAFVLFILDTALLLLLVVLEGVSEGFSIVLEIVFHVWALWSLFTGVRARSRLKKLSAAQQQ